VTAKVRSFRSTRKLGRALLGLLALDVVLSVVMVVLRLFENGLLQRAARGELVSFAEAARNDERVAAITILQVVMLLLTGVIWLVWQHRSQTNLHAARLRELTFSPGWTVGWWLIPLANFVMPFQTMRELWKASTGDERWWQLRTSPIIGSWWAAWLGANVLDRVAGAVTGGASTIDKVISGSRLFLFGEIVTISAGILALAIIRSVIERQEGLLERPVPAGALPPRPDIPEIQT
jgi:hypothetical protein